MKGKTEALIVGIMCILVCIALFVCNPARIEGEMPAWSIALCVSPLILSIPCWVIVFGDDEDNDGE